MSDNVTTLNLSKMQNDNDCNTAIVNIVNENKGYIMKYSIILILISLTLALIGVIDYYEGWTANNKQLLFALYGINWFVLALNIMYFINTTQRSTIVTKFKKFIEKNKTK
jgi:hypothetical protein